MALTCKQAAGDVVLNSSSITSAKGSFISALTVYNADTSSTTFTFKFKDSSEGDLEVSLARVVIPAKSTAQAANFLPHPLILSNSDELKVYPSAGGGTHQYTFSEKSNNNVWSSKAYVVTDTNLTTIAENQALYLQVNFFNNKILLADSPVSEAFDGVLTNICFKQSIDPLKNIIQRYPTLVAGDTIKARASSGSSSDFHIYAVHV